MQLYRAGQGRKDNAPAWTWPIPWDWGCKFGCGGVNSSRVGPCHLVSLVVCLLQECVILL